MKTSLRETVLARNLYIRQLADPKVRNWIMHYAWRDGAFDRTKLLQFVRYVCVAHEREISEITKYYGYREAYPDIPAVKLFGCDGPADNFPDIWIMGWRKGELTKDATSIHDHGNSAAAILVVEGTVTEYHYDVDHKDWETGKNPLPCRPARRVILRQGESLEIEVPYIHRMLEARTGSDGFSVHGYYPGLSNQKSYVHVGDTLIENGSWSEEAGFCGCDTAS